MKQEETIGRLNFSLSEQTAEKVEAIWPHLGRRRATVVETMILEMVKLMETEPERRTVPQIVLQYDAVKRPVSLSSKHERGHELREDLPTKSPGAEQDRRK